MFSKRMLQRAYDWCSDNACDWGDEYMRVAALCVKKQIPKEVLEKQDPHQSGTYSGRCPECGYNAIQSDTHVFCPKCGQALKWNKD